MWGEVLVVALVSGVVSAFLCETTASRKGYKSENWAIVGLILGPLGLLAAAGLPDLKLQRYLRLVAEHQGISKDAFLAIESDPCPIADHLMADDPGEMRPAVGDDWGAVVSYYNERGGLEAPNRAKSAVLAMSISLCNEQGQKLAYFRKVRSWDKLYWQLVKLYR